VLLLLLLQMKAQAASAAVRDVYVDEMRSTITELCRLLQRHQQQPMSTASETTRH